MCLSPALLSTLETLGYETPTEIQQKLIPLVFQGRDVMGIAQTGTGKTAAYALPLIDLILSGRRRAGMATALVLVPTRELADQVSESLATYGGGQGIKTATLIGGTAQSKQLMALSKGPDVIIATPGRFLDFYDRGKILLAGIQFLVIDEADRMLDMGFMPDVERINQLIPSHKQCLFLSATMAKGVQVCAEKLLNEPAIVKVKPEQMHAKNIDQRFLVTKRFSESQAYKKRKILRDLIEKHKIQHAMIFCNRKTDVDELERSMKRHGFSVRGFHGDIHQSKRTDMLSQFKNQELDFLIASDVGARGIDVEGLPFVINYDFPPNPEDYVHRIGRTGRAGLTGHAWTFLLPDDFKRARSILPKELVYETGYELDAVGSGEKAGKPAEKKHHKKTENKPEAKKSFKESREVVSEVPVKGFGDELPAFLKADFKVD